MQFFLTVVLAHFKINYTFTVEKMFEYRWVRNKLAKSIILNELNLNFTL